MALQGTNPWHGPRLPQGLTKRLELLLRTVLALPKASSSGLDCRMMSFTCWWPEEGTSLSRAAHLCPLQLPAPTGDGDMSPAMDCSVQGLGEQRGQEAKLWVLGWGQPYLHLVATPRHFGDVAHDVFCCHCFPGPAFSTV